jgi:hypothetical protein
MVAGANGEFGLTAFFRFRVSYPVLSDNFFRFRLLHHGACGSMLAVCLGPGRVGRSQFGSSWLLACTGLMVVVRLYASFHRHRQFVRLLRLPES